MSVFSSTETFSTSEKGMVASAGADATSATAKKEGEEDEVFYKEPPSIPLAETLYSLGI